MDLKATSEHKLELATDLLDDLELNRLAIDGLLLKAKRLARIIGNERVETWLHFEMSGFNASNSVSIEYMDLTWRWTDKAKGLAYWGGLAQISAQMSASQDQLKCLRIPDVSYSPSSANPQERVTGFYGDAIGKATQPINDVLSTMSNLNNTVTMLSGIRNRVLSLLHTFVSGVYYELKFSSMQGTIFERTKADVDFLLGEACGEVLKRVPAIYERLAANDSEAIAQALVSCRRIVDAFADAMFPPRDVPFDLNGTALAVKDIHHKNRINAYIYTRCKSGSVREKIRKKLDILYDRVSTGVHQEVSLVEARYLFLDTYLLLGEIMSLPAHDHE